MSISSYSSIFNLGHRAIANLFSRPIIIEEKIDGSQFSFGVDESGTLHCRSKGSEINLSAPEKMFAAGVEYVQSIAARLTPGDTYRGEYLKSPHHNALTYSRIPRNHIIIFDIEAPGQNFYSPAGKAAEAARIGLECVPCFANSAVISDPNELRAYLDRESILGGCKIEGVVIKPAGYDMFNIDKKVLLAKFVSEEFKEIHNKTWDREHKTPGSNDVLTLLKAKYSTVPRWQKAVQHLTESGIITGNLTDIQHLIKEIPADVERECKAQIMEDLYAWAWPQLRRGLTAGFPEWYKDQLVRKQFNETEKESDTVNVSR